MEKKPIFKKRIVVACLVLLLCLIIVGITLWLLLPPEKEAVMEISPPEPFITICDIELDNLVKEIIDILDKNNFENPVIRRNSIETRWKEIENKKPKERIQVYIQIKRNFEKPIECFDIYLFPDVQVKYRWRDWKSKYLSEAEEDEYIGNIKSEISEIK